MYSKESHLRSVVKGISWRFIATSDTILIVLFITCLYGECSIGNALKIGAIEFVIKILIYYLHERFWQKLIKTRIVSKRISLLKTISWRIIATTTTFIISGAVLNSFNEVALFIALLESSTKFILYFLHERLWLKLPIGFFHKFIHKNKRQ
ncbi:MAG: DUF2061 domain-containing protein [Bacteroidetes bacterium]|nr:DUF2061 domain-containing protein [Bacteroidota bacterium]